MNAGEAGGRAVGNFLFSKKFFFLFSFVRCLEGLEWQLTPDDGRAQHVRENVAKGGTVANLCYCLLHAASRKQAGPRRFEGGESGV